MENKQQTAVEWIINQLRQLAHNPSTHLGMGDVRVTQGMIDELEEQAKQMEKEQIVVSFYEGIKTNTCAPNTGRGLIHYNETYGKGI